MIISVWRRAAGSRPEGLSINGSQPVQVTRPLHAVNAAVLPLGGRVNTIAFAVTREHVSHGAAEGFLFAHAATLPQSGNATFLCEDVDGPQVQYAAAAAAVSADLGTQNGNHTTHRYTLVCGALTAGSWVDPARQLPFQSFAFSSYVHPTCPSGNPPPHR